MNADDLVKMPEDEFRAVVDDEVRGHLDDDTSRLLRDAKVFERWNLALIAMKKSVENQIAAKREDLSKPGSGIREKNEFRRWRGGALRFKNGVEDRIIEVRSLRIQHYGHSDFADFVKQERNEALFVNMTLRRAIEAHQKSVLADFAEGEVSDADRKLWETISS